MEEYIKKSELFDKTVRKNSIWNEVTNAEGKGLEEIVNSLPTYSMPVTATSGEYIRRADMDRILYSTNNPIRIGEEFLDLPTYSIPDIEKIRAEIENLDTALLCELKLKGKALSIIDKHIGGNK